jgi:DNA-3-methyladenine glycosylase II
MVQPITLNQECKAIQHLCKKDKRLAKVISTIGPITYTPYEDAYSFLVHEIIEQMLSIKAGAKIYSRLEELCNGCITPFTVNALTDSQIKSIGTSNSKVTYIRTLTNNIILKQIDLDYLKLLSNEEVYNILLSIHGIGKWTAKMFLIFVLDRQNILPYEDAAFIQSYKWLYKTNDISKGSIKKKCQKWNPYSSIAARYLYRALDIGLTKEEFHLFK